MKRHWGELLKARWALDKFVCVGLDSERRKIPNVAQSLGVAYFNQQIVEATADIVVSYKPNLAFYMALGADGLNILKKTIQHINSFAPSVPVILDAKYADIGNTNNGYAEMAFDHLGADAVTVHPYLGAEALEPFLSREDKGVIVLVRTSNPGAKEFQDQPDSPTHLPLWQVVAHSVAKKWNTRGNCAVVFGATYPGELAIGRGIVGDLPMLIPGIGAQGGDVEKAVKAGKDSRRQGMIINSSRGIIFASNGPDFAQAARRETHKLHELINKYR